MLHYLVRYRMRALAIFPPEKLERITVWSDAAAVGLARRPLSVPALVQVAVLSEQVGADRVPFAGLSATSVAYLLSRHKEVR